MKRITKYGIAGLLAAPVLLPLGFASYALFKTARWSLRCPKKALASAALVGMLWYGDNVQFKHYAKTAAVETLHAAKRSIDTVVSRPSTTAEVSSQGETPQPLAVQQPQARYHEPVLDDWDFYFYYAKLGESLEDIAEKTMGQGALSTIIQDNNIGTELLAGQLLKIRKSAYNGNVEVHYKVPNLRSVILPGSIKLSDYLNYDHIRTQQVLTLNRKLGLEYTDDFPYKNSARVVYLQ